jgi:hypothetical protein
MPKNSTTAKIKIAKGRNSTSDGSFHDFLHFYTSAHRKINTKPTKKKLFAYVLPPTQLTPEPHQTTHPQQMRPFMRITSPAIHMHWHLFSWASSGEAVHADWFSNRWVLERRNGTHVWRDICVNVYVNLLMCMWVSMDMYVYILGDVYDACMMIPQNFMACV